MKSVKDKGTRATRCDNSACARPLPGPVKFCPFCGQEHLTVPIPVPPPVVQAPPAPAPAPVPPPAPAPSAKPVIASAPPPAPPRPTRQIRTKIEPPTRPSLEAWIAVLQWRAKALGTTVLKWAKRILIGFGVVLLLMLIYIIGFAPRQSATPETSPTEPTTQPTAPASRDTPSGARGADAAKQEAAKQEAARREAAARAEREQAQKEQARREQAQREQAQREQARQEQARREAAQREAAALEQMRTNSTPPVPPRPAPAPTPRAPASADNTQRQLARDLVENGRAQLRAKDYNAAISTANMARRYDPDNPDVNALMREAIRERDRVLRNATIE